MANRGKQKVHRIPVEDGALVLVKDWMAAPDAFEIFSCLREELSWEQSIIRIAGVQRVIPRLNAWYGDEGAGYRYSNTWFDPHPWTPTLSRLRREAACTAACPFNSVLANLYRDGSDSVGWHSDDEPELGTDPVIASLSLGSERRFVLKHKRKRSLQKIDIMLPSGSLLVMSGATQHHWVHQLPKTRIPVGPRINLTFRRIVASG